MAYTVNFGLMNKKVNSTKRDFTVNFSASCSLKIPSDVYAPTFLVHGGFPPTNNYFHVPDFGRYYWITNINFNSGNWEVSGKCDALATFRDEIGASNQFILRASNLTVRNAGIIDNLAMAINPPEVVQESKPIGLSGTGCYVVCCVGTGGNNFYLLNQANWSALYSKVFTSGFLQNNFDVWQAITQDFCNTVLNPQDYIINARWLPVPITVGTLAGITLGFTNTGVGGNLVEAGTAVFDNTVSFSVPAHPQSETYGTFLNGNLYRKVTLSLPGYGNLVLDADALSYNPVVSVHAVMDVTGVLTYSINYANKHTYVCCDLSADAGYSVTKSSVTSAIANVGGVAGAAAAGDAGQALMSLANCVYAAIPQVERACAGGSRSALVGGANVILSTMFYKIADYTGERIGYACCKTLNVGNVGGFILCRNASVSCTGSQAEISEIVSYMNSGFYYE